MANLVFQHTHSILDEGGMSESQDASRVGAIPSQEEQWARKFIFGEQSRSITVDPERTDGDYEVLNINRADGLDSQMVKFIVLERIKTYSSTLKNLNKDHKNLK